MFPEKLNVCVSDYETFMIVNIYCSYAKVRMALLLGPGYIWPCSVELQTHRGGC